jgi:hypothetical protein
VVPPNSYKIDQRLLETVKEIKEPGFPKNDINYNEGSQNCHNINKRFWETKRN